ncbi:MAG: hypothetical protein J6Q73_03510 [Bacteroidaceae bacterium]|nr:hypothetical protein [Bacteroidaceae bacterium]
MNNEFIYEQTLKLLEYIEKEEYLGYDPYDFYLSPYAKFFPKSILFLHIQKVIPLNFRKLLKIKKGMVTKVHALIIDSYINLYKLTGEEKYIYKAKILYKRMMESAFVINNDEIGWGRNYPFKTGGEIHDNKKPLVYLNSRLGQTMINMYDITNDKAILADLEKVIRNLIRTGRVLRKDGYSFIGYSPDVNTRLTFNVSMVAVELMMKYLDRSKNTSFEVDGYNIKDVCNDIVRTIIHYQEEDGSWAYGYSAKGVLFSQKDFHQGFVIDSLYKVLPYIENADLKEEAHKVYKKGYEYLKNIQISKNGEFFWRYPKKYPIDIHNSAQGILSLSINKEDKNCEKLKTLIEYIFKTFWNKKEGCFYYQKWRFFINKISYMRWCNSWMLYSMTELLLSNKLKH